MSDCYTLNTLRCSHIVVLLRMRCMVGEVFRRQLDAKENAAENTNRPEVLTLSKPSTGVALESFKLDAMHEALKCEHS